MAVSEQCIDNNAQLSKFFLNGEAKTVFGFLLFIIEVAILKIIYKTASSNINLTLKVIGRMILPLA